MTIDDGSEADLDGAGLAVAQAIWVACGFDQIVQQVRGTSPGVLDAMPPLEADLVFIDGEHRGGQPLLDYKAALRHLGPTGCIVFHDVQAKYSVSVAVNAAKADGFICLPLPTSCEPVIACRREQQVELGRIALQLARMNLMIEWGPDVDDC